MMERVLASVLTAVTAGFVATSAALPEEVAESLQKRITAGYNMSVEVGVQDASGAHYFSLGRRAAGLAAPDERTIFEIGSITKVFTATLLWQMVQRGEVALQDPIAKYLPPGVKPPESGRPITLEDLATHMSGLPRLPSNLQIKNAEDPYAEYTPEGMWSFLSSYTLPRPVGSKYEYSNVGAALLGQLLARRAGTSYAEAITRVTQPLGLTDTTITLSPAQEARLAPGHSGVAPVATWHAGAIEPAGGLRSDAVDLLRFTAANAGLLKDVPATQFSGMHSRRQPAGEHLGIGLGWHIRENGARPIVWHNGGTGGYRCFAGFIAGERAVVVLSNSNQGLDDVGTHLLEPSLPLTALPETVPVDPRTLATYAGRYQLGFAVADVQVINDRLTVQLTNQPRFTLYASSPTEFFLTVVPAKITFAPDAAGHVTEFVLHQNGLTPHARRIENK
jgi:CubicO group peptidase (beta-lactamase class C family)